MDPNVALESILRGYLIADHAEALAGWLANGGFAPQPHSVQPVGCTPVDLAPFVLAHCAKHYPRVELEAITVRADRHGLWTSSATTAWISLAIWSDLYRMGNR